MVNKREDGRKKKWRAVQAELWGVERVMGRAVCAHHPDRKT